MRTLVVHDDPELAEHAAHAGPAASLRVFPARTLCGLCGDQPSLEVELLDRVAEHLVTNPRGPA
ncbi:MAG: hypothetical protein RIF41_35665 [Polyangiaceae bacterium]